MTNKDQFDELLDHALSEYREAEPLSGLEDRVLQRLRIQREERRNPRWMWGAVAACAALLLIGVWVGTRKQISGVSSGENKEVAGVGKTPTQAKEAWVGHPAREQVSPSISSPENREFARVAKRPTPPKEGGVGHPAVATPPVFPTPTPLTAQERAYVASLQGNSTVAASGTDPDSLIAIAEIQIKPLTVSGQSSGGDQ